MSATTWAVIRGFPACETCSRRTSMSSADGSSRRGRRYRISKTEQRRQRRKRKRSLVFLEEEKPVFLLRYLRFLRCSVFEIRYLRLLRRLRGTIDDSRETEIGRASCRERG